MRLIDADKLEYRIVAYLGEFSRIPLDDIIKGWRKIVDAQPTAYDVDKVVERLICESINGHIMTDRAVEIVKSGGIE